MKRILALDGGGIRGLFTLQILAKIEELLRQQRGRRDLVLADEFDLFAGTSTGAIIATGLCWGMSVSQIEEFYLQHGREMFSRVSWYRRWKCKYRAELLAEFFRKVFSENDASDTPALLGTDKLKKLLLVVIRNASTGSPWPVTNNPHSLYNNPALADCNLNIPLWQLLRASTAAPTFYAPEAIRFGDQEFLFVDGAITPFNNPALIAVMMATLEPYKICWPASPEELAVVSVGTGGIPARLAKKLPGQVHLLDQAGYVPLALISSSIAQQDALCRILGECRYGQPLDSEIGDLLEPTLFSADEQKFSYVRYDARLDQLIKSGTRLPGIDDLSSIPLLKELGQQYACEHVLLEHLQV